MTGIDRADTLDKIRAHVLKDESYDWEYSNFGIAVLGTTLGEVYDKSYKLLAEDFIKNDLGLNQTRKPGEIVICSDIKRLQYFKSGKERICNEEQLNID
ncbi:MAG TPA: hypothetical protein PKW67_02845 [Syntrophomonadaceae bacterium]|nr:hypothetical protein [Syntrophomonadaceae bacterium]